MADQLDKLTDFIAITGADTDAAKQYLEFADYDLESAVTLFLEGGGGGSTAARTAPAVGSGAPDARSAAGTHGAPAATNNDFEFEDDDAALSRRLQEEEYQAAATSEERVRDTIAPVRETLVEPEYRKFIMFQQHVTALQLLGWYT